MSRRLVVGGRIVMAAVVAGNVVGLVGNAAAAFCFQRTAYFHLAVSAAYAANNAAAKIDLKTLGRQQLQLALPI